MLIEFVGLPGSGKTSVIVRTEKTLRKAGYRAGGLRNLAQSAIPAATAKIRFLHHRGERMSLFGCLEFRKQNPEVFDLLCTSQEHIPDLTLWTMDMLSQMHFVKPLVKQGVATFCDEGLLQHGIANFVARNDIALFERYNHALPDDFILVHLDGPVELALERARSRRRGLTVTKYHKNRDPVDVMNEIQSLMSVACDIRRARGLPVIVLDARTPLKDLSAQLAGQLVDMLGPQDPEVPVLEDCTAKPA